MSSGGNRHIRPLTLVSSHAGASDAGQREPATGVVDARARALDWSILMAHAQAGEQDAYRRLLEEITPYVRSLAAKCHRNSSDIEDSVQDVLLTVHAIRHTYDPKRPFGPWLWPLHIVASPIACVATVATRPGRRRLRMSMKPFPTLQRTTR